MSEEFSKTELLIGSDAIKKLASCRVAVFGVGGVGGYAVEALIRSGLGNIDIIDNDKVCESNINRQIIASTKTIDRYKVDAAKERILEINPNVNVKTYKTFFTPQTSDEFDFRKYDYVIDACDTVSIKKEIIKICTKNKIKFISCMGTGNKLNPSMLEVTDIRKTSYDPLAKKLRKMVKDERISGKVPVVCSREVPIKVNSNNVGSTSFVPATAGLLITSYIINDIVGDL